MTAGERGAVCVRALTAGDGLALAAFFRSLAEDTRATAHFHPHPLDGPTAERIASYADRDLYLGYFAGGEILGYGLLRGWDDGYDVPSFGVAVRADARESGIGSALLGACIEAARQRGASTLMLKVHQDNARALEWYLTAGFEVVGATDDGQHLCHLSLAAAAPTSAPDG